MENIKVVEIDFTNHIHKCRICFKSFCLEEHRIQISKVIQKKFKEITQNELKITPKFSKVICVVCNYQLTVLSQARSNIIKSQKALVKFESEALQNKFLDQKIEITSTGSINEFTKESLKFNFDPNLNINEAIFTCDICGFITPIKSSLIPHINSHKTFNCSQCNVDFQTYTDLFHHRQKIHQDTIQKWICHYCNKSFSGGGSLTNHISIYHTKTSIELQCPAANCDKKCKTKKQLSQHMKIHSDDKQICPECGIVVGNKHNLTKHIKRMHLKIYNFYCDLCDYKGFFKFNIVEHMKRHLSKENREIFFCDQCKFKSISQMSLKTHKRMEHLGQKKTYICQCGKTFTQSSSFYTHLKVVHDKIKNHVCGFKKCAKAFAEKSQLRNHVKLQHLKQRDLPCEFCSKLFATKKHLSAHLKYHESPTYPCEVDGCGKSFYTLTQLKSHYKVHNNQKDFECHLCDKKYFHRSHLKKHLMSHK